MNETMIYETLTRALRDVFDDRNLVASPALTATQVSGWDSLGNIRLILEIEKSLNVRFTTAEIASLKNVGALADLIASKMLQ